jgi:hypothetical protein
VLAGILTRRPLPAMATTLAGYIAARVAVSLWVRPHLLAPISVTEPLDDQRTPQLLGSGPGAERGRWILSQTVTDPSGTVIDSVRVTPGDPCEATRSCLSGFRVTTVYQPADRYWTFQWAETALFVGLALLLVGVAYWCLRRRLS